MSFILQPLRISNLLFSLTNHFTELVHSFIIDPLISLEEFTEIPKVEKVDKEEDVTGILKHSIICH